MFYLNCFFIYSILGWCLETIVSFIFKTNFQSGILKGPWTPIYGIGTLVILFISHYLFYNLHMPRWIETIIVFFVVAIVLSFFRNGSYMGNTIYSFYIYNSPHNRKNYFKNPLLYYYYIIRIIYIRFRNNCFY